MLPRSRANGPGLRFVIWAQGCTLACPGCFNPETHPVQRAVGATAEDLAAAALDESIRAAWDGLCLDGVTLTGGEPLEQPAAAAAFCRRVRQRSDLGIVILTGFTRNEIERDPARAAAVADADLVIAGRYNENRRLASGLRGSANKAYWARTGRYSAADCAALPEAEIVIGPDGTLTLTGTPLSTRLPGPGG